MLFFPREWDGIHEAFPKEPEAYDTRNPLLFQQTSTLTGLFAGGVWAIARALQRKPYNHAVLRAVGALAIPFSAYAIGIDELQRREVIDDIRTVLASDRIALPRRKFFKRTQEWTADDFSVIGGSVATSTLLLMRRAPNFPRVGPLSIIGAFALGSFAATSIWINNISAKSPLPMQIYMMESERASRIFAQKTGKEPPPYLYPMQSVMHEDPDMERKRRNLDLLADAFSPGGVSSSSESHQASDDATADLDELLEVGGAAHGLHPHASLKNSDGTEVFFPQRDYEWNPVSKADGLQALQKHLEVLSKARANRAEEAEFIWNMMARREARHYPPYGRDPDSQETLLERKALEFLSSTHCMMWKLTADLDWSIANTKKLILQMQTDGQWLPESASVERARSPSTQRARENLLQHLRDHLHKLEQDSEAMEAMIANAPAGIPQLYAKETEGARQEVASNREATQQLIDELERG